MSCARTREEAGKVGPYGRLGSAVGVLGVVRRVGSLGRWRPFYLARSGRMGLSDDVLVHGGSHCRQDERGSHRHGSRSVSKPALLVSLTGVLEGLGAVGLLIPATRGLAGLCLVLLLVALLPANVSAARRGVSMRGRAPTPLLVRIPMQILFVGLTCGRPT